MDKIFGDDVVPVSLAALVPNVVDTYVGSEGGVRLNGSARLAG